MDDRTPRSGVGRRIVGLLLILAALALAGCATTQPWERGALAEEIMNPEGDPQVDELNHHVLSTREGTSGSFGGGGGGCGCN